MKKAILFYSLIFLSLAGYAQVAINANGSTPNASAMLDITSSNKGLLIPRIYLSSSVDNASIPSPAHSLLVYNTNTGMSKGAGFYYNTGTSNTPNWQAMQDLILPSNTSTSTAGAAFTIGNYSQDNNSTAIKAVGGGAGRALDVDGRMKIAGAGQSPGQGKVLTSDANGNATWQGAIAFRAAGIISTGSQVIAHYTATRVRFATVNHNLGAGYSGPDAPTHSVFTAPVLGIYHFDASVLWDADYLDGYFASFKLVTHLNGNYNIVAEHTANFPDLPFLQQQVSIDVELQAGQQIYAEVHHNTGDYRKLYYSNESTYFSGHLVVKL